MGSGGLLIGALLLFSLTGCTSIDTVRTGGVNVRAPAARTCYPQESFTQPRFGNCPGYHEGPSGGTPRGAK
jgi:hypothetical protein